MTAGLRLVAPLPASLSEADFQRTVMDSAKALRWRVHHSRPVQIRPGRHATPISGHAGLPDLVLARRGVVLLVELKTERGRVSPEQQAWAEALGGFYRLWRPSDWPGALAELRDAA